MGRLCEVNESTIRYIRKNKKAIRESVAASDVLRTKVVNYVWDVYKERMEKTQCMD